MSRLRSRLKGLLLLAAGVVIGACLMRMASPPPPVPRDEADAGLDRVIPEVRFANTPLDEAIRTLGRQTGANIVVNWKLLETAADIGRDTPVTLEVRGLTLGLVLRAVLDEVSTPTARVGYTVQDGVVLVSVGEDLARSVDPRVYDVRDILAAAKGRHIMDPPSPFDEAEIFPPQAHHYPDEVELMEELIELVTTSVAPDTWKGGGGSVGSTRAFAGQLAILRTPENHKRVWELREKLRRG